MANGKRFRETVKCPNCGALAEVSQPETHSEYTPTGKCPNCGKLVIMNIYIKDGHIKKEIRAQKG